MHRSLKKVVTKFNAYGLEQRSLGFIHPYLSKCKERTKVDSAFSSWEILFSAVPQGSILWPILFNIFICDLFFETLENIDFAGYANDKLLFTYSSKIEDVLANLQGASEKLFEWFSANHLLVNSGKCHLLTSFNLPVDIRITNTKVFNEERVKFLGVNFRSRRNLKDKSNVPLSCQNMQ